MSKKAKIEDSDDDLTWGERREMEDNKPLFPFPREKLHTFFHSLPRAVTVLPKPVCHPKTLEAKRTRNVRIEDSNDDVPIFSKKIRGCKPF